ncbi:MAG: DinB family protein [Bacteroidota bacterium]|nr:DinB family protein [Bacteroidota bacterium]
MIDTITRLKDTIDEILNSDVDRIDWVVKPGPDKWSKKQIIGHLIDSAQINLQRFVRCTYEENFKLTYEQVEWIEAQHYQQADVNELLGLWKLLNLQISRVLANYPPERLQAKCDNSKTTPSLHTIEWLAADYVEHMRHHLKQIINLK